MSALTMNPSVPHRKPLPTFEQPSAPSFVEHATHPRTTPSRSVPHSEPSHFRTRTNSSALMPASLAPAAANTRPTNTMTSQSQYPAYPAINTRRTLSNATSSSSSASLRPGPPHATTASEHGSLTGPRRSTSSRSNTSIPPTSYVALMRKQKATVWCDRAQHEDPRILVAQRAAKMRAAMEVAGGHNHGGGANRISSSSSGMVGGVRSKIRHHGAPKASTYNGSMVSGVGVPMRLSATEVDDADSDDAESRRYHSRNGSGRSSMTSGQRGYSFAGPDNGYSNQSSPSMQSPMEQMNEANEDQTPMPKHDRPGGDYFAQSGGQGDSAGSGSSGGSVQREENFGSVGGLPHRTRVTLDEQRKKDDDLKRRGSVDDRTMTMGGGRLFVANPDLSD